MRHDDLTVNIVPLPHVAFQYHLDRFGLSVAKPHGFSMRVDVLVAENKQHHTIKFVRSAGAAGSSLRRGSTEEATVFALQELPTVRLEFVWKTLDVEDEKGAGPLVSDVSLLVGISQISAEVTESMTSHWLTVQSKLHKEFTIFLNAAIKLVERINRIREKRREEALANREEVLELVSIRCGFSDRLICFLLLFLSRVFLLSFCGLLCVGEKSGFCMELNLISVERRF